MNNSNTGNLLLIANYPSDTAYAWWLMEHFWVSIAEIFTTPNRRVYLAYPKVTDISETILNSSIEVIELTIPWTNKTQYSHARNFFHKNNITFVYFTDQQYFSFHYAIMRYHGIRRIVIHDHTPGDRPPITGLKGALKAAKNMIPWITADRVLCVSPLMRKRNITNTRIPEHKCLTVQNGIQPVNCSKNNTYIRESIGVDNKSLLITTTGRAHPYKRFDFIIESAMLLKKQSPNCKVVFLIIGDGPAMPQLESLIRKYNLENTVKLLGFRNDIRLILCASDIAFHAALGEGFSLSIIEYMSAGLPVIVPDIASVSQAIIHNKTGLLYKKDDPKAAALCIEKLANNETLRLTMGDTARDAANNNYNLKQCTRDFIKEIKKAYFSNN